MLCVLLRGGGGLWGPAGCGVVRSSEGRRGVVWLLACGIERGCEGIVSFGDEDRGLAVFVLRGEKETSWIVVAVRWRSGVDDGLMWSFGFLVKRSEIRGSLMQHHALGAILAGNINRWCRGTRPLTSDKSVVQSCKLDRPPKTNSKSAKSSSAIRGA
jgi:hypothetical protein